MSLTVVLLIVAAVVVLLVAGLITLLWFIGWDSDRFWAPRRAAIVEARERTADRVADFGDWLRLGR
jgi:hypothetical protein